MKRARRRQSEGEKDKKRVREERQRLVRDKCKKGLKDVGKQRKREIKETGIERKTKQSTVAGRRYSWTTLRDMST